jgi:hypothetical protein
MKEYSSARHLSLAYGPSQAKPQQGIVREVAGHPSMPYRFSNSFKPADFTTGLGFTCSGALSCQKSIP